MPRAPASRRAHEATSQLRKSMLFGASFLSMRSSRAAAESGGRRRRSKASVRSESEFQVFPLAPIKLACSWRHERPELIRVGAGASLFQRGAGEWTRPNCCRRACGIATAAKAEAASAAAAAGGAIWPPNCCAHLCGAWRRPNTHTPAGFSSRRSDKAGARLVGASTLTAGLESGCFLAGQTALPRVRVAISCTEKRRQFFAQRLPSDLAPFRRRRPA